MNIIRRLTTVAVLVVIVTAAVFVSPQNVAAKSKSIFKLSKKNIRISKNTDVSITSNKKNEKISIIVQKPNIAAVSQKSQKGKKTVFTVQPKMKGSTNVTFIAGKKKATLKVRVTKTSFDSIKNGFTAQMFVSSYTGTNNSVRFMIRNHTGLNAYLADSIKIYGDLSWDGHWFDPNADVTSQFVTQYATVGPDEDRQVEYFNAPVYGLRLSDTYNIMTFRKQAYAVLTVYFDQPTTDNAYIVTVDTNGVTSMVKL